MTPNVLGALDVVSWFGQWPTFHDAEVLTVVIQRGGMSAIRIHTWNVHQMLDADGKFVQTNHGVVVFEFSGIRRLTLSGEDADVQNVISGLIVDSLQDGYRLELSPSYGLYGTVLTKNLTVKVESVVEAQTQPH